MTFLGPELWDDVPDARTIWLFRETPRQAGARTRLFARLDAMLDAPGFSASGGQIVDPTFVEAPRQRNGRDDNAAIKNGAIPKDWSDKKKAHKDADARRAKKNGVAFYGTENHPNVDRKRKFVRKCQVRP